MIINSYLNPYRLQKQKNDFDIKKPSPNDLSQTKLQTKQLVINLFIYFSINLFLPVYIYLFLYLSIYLSIYLSQSVHI